MKPILMAVRQRAGRGAFLLIAAWGMIRGNNTLIVLGLIGCLWLYSLAVWVTAYTSQRPQLPAVDGGGSDNPRPQPPEDETLPRHLRGRDLGKPFGYARDPG